MNETMPLSVVLVGSGQMAWQLGHAFRRAGIPVLAVLGRSEAPVRALADAIGAQACLDPRELAGLRPSACLLCLSDDALNSYPGRLELPADTLLAHTSGSQPLEVLAPFHANRGVFYPLQTMNRTRPLDFGKIPIFVEADSESGLGLLLELGRRLSPHTRQAGTGARQTLHLAAVFACNFANHLWALADELLAPEGLSVHDLGHLVAETADKALRMPPREAQTGPAVRGDEGILQAHLSRLRPHPYLHEVYALLSEGIRHQGPAGTSYPKQQTPLNDEHADDASAAP
jgi:predicted short-subunit dehydrogenase-like oxidoreductase (DUF2520 family)